MGKILTVIAALCLALSAALTGCNSSGCTESLTSVPLAGFYSYNNGQAIAIDSVEIGGIGAPRDSLLVYRGSVREVYLPLRPGRESVSFFFRYVNRAALDLGIVDTLTFTYETIPYFASEDCGAMYRYRITGATHTRLLLDSVAILDPYITNVEIQRIQLYYATE